MNGATVKRGNSVYNPKAPLQTRIDQGALRDPMSSWYKADPNQRSAQSPLVDAFGRVVPPRDDPAFQPPSDPLQPVQPGLVHRQIPNVTTQTGYAPNDVRAAIGQLVIGLFDLPSQMTDTVLADSRVSATMNSRCGGIFGRPMKFRTPKGYEDDKDARRALSVWRHHWDDIFPESVASEFLRWVVMQGFGPAQQLWNVDGKYAIPQPVVWHPRYTYYHWLFRCYVAITQDGQVPITPGDGHWILHAPHGAERGWMRGAVWSIAPWWLARNYALRDWARYSERHGMPIIKAKTPAAADPASIAAFRGAVATLGQESVVQVPQGVEPQYSYDLELMEATDQGWMGFHQLIEQCNTEITLSIMGQNLTTEVKEGSFAAARVHADVRQSLLQSDARALERTIRQQIARPFALMNWGRPEIAPVTEFELDPYEDAATVAKTFQSFAQAVYQLRQAGKQIGNLRELAAGFGLDIDVADVAAVKPIAIESASASGGSGGEK